MDRQFEAELCTCLDRLEQELKHLGLWSLTPPAQEALLSTLPFCMDTLCFHEWIQFVLIERLRALKGQQAELGQMLVHPMAEEVYRGQWVTYRGLISALKELDACFERHCS